MPQNQRVTDSPERPYRGPDDLIAMQRAVQRTWTPDSHWHIGDLAWQRLSMADRTAALWTGPDGAVDSWAWISPIAPRMELDGYRVRAIRDGETAARAAAHRAAWRPQRVGRLQVPPVELSDGESGLTTGQ